jgi:hypothetical protein
VARGDDPLQTVKEFDGMLDSIAEMLEVTERTRSEATTLSTVANNNLSELAFGQPLFMFNHPFPEETGPSLVIHGPSSETPSTVKVTKVGSEGSPSLEGSPSEGPSLEGTSLEDLFAKGFPSRMRSEYEEDDYGIDHESIHSEEEDEEEVMIPMEHEGKSYFRSSLTHRIYAKGEDGIPGPCAGVWMFQQFVPLDGTSGISPPAQVRIEKADA